MRTHLKCYLDCLCLYKNQIHEQLLSGNIMDNLMVKHLFFVVFSRHLVLQLRGSTLLSQLSVWMTPICMEGLMGSYWLQLLLIQIMRFFLWLYTIVKEENNVNWRWFLLFIQLHIIGDCSGICIISDIHVDIKHGMTTIFPEPIGYYRYYIRYLTSNFNHKFKDLSAKKELLRCTMNLWSINLMYGLMIWVIVI
jgi:hypothetical protein